MKQKLESLLQHFDDDGKLLPGNALMENPAGCWKLSPRTTLDYMLKEITNGVDFRIELTPVAPRVVTIRFDLRNDAIACHPEHREAIRFIEDKPLPVSDEMVNAGFAIHRQGLFHSGEEAMRAVLEHYESKRTEHL